MHLGSAMCAPFFLFLCHALSPPVNKVARNIDIHSILHFPYGFLMFVTVTVPFLHRDVNRICYRESSTWPSQSLVLQCSHASAFKFQHHTSKGQAHQSQMGFCPLR